VRLLIKIYVCLEQEPLMKNGHSAAAFIAQVNGDVPMDVLNV
jgi:hypothetical protein